MFDIQTVTKPTNIKPETGPGYVLTEHRFPEPMKLCNAFAIDPNFEYDGNSIYRIPYPVVYRAGEWFNAKFIDRNKPLTVQVVGWNYRLKDV